MKKIQMEVFPVNLQQGFLMGGTYIVAAYSHHKKTIWVKVPNNLDDYELPENYKDYSVVRGLTDSFGIDMYTHAGTKSLHV